MSAYSSYLKATALARPGSPADEWWQRPQTMRAAIYKSTVAPATWDHADSSQSQLTCDDSPETVTTGDDHCPELQRRGPGAERSAAMSFVATSLRNDPVHTCGSVDGTHRHASTAGRPAESSIPGRLIDSSLHKLKPPWVGGDRSKRAQGAGVGGREISRDGVDVAPVPSGAIYEKRRFWTKDRRGELIQRPCGGVAVVRPESVHTLSARHHQSQYKLRAASTRETEGP